MKTVVTEHRVDIEGDGWTLSIFDESAMWQKPERANKIVSISKGGDGGAPGEDGHNGAAIIFSTLKKEGSASGGLGVLSFEATDLSEVTPVIVSSGGGGVAFKNLF